MRTLALVLALVLCLFAVAPASACDPIPLRLGVSASASLDLVRASLASEILARAVEREALRAALSEPSLTIVSAERKKKIKIIRPVQPIIIR